MKDSAIKLLSKAIEKAKTEKIEVYEEYEEYLNEVQNRKGGGNEIQQKALDLSIKINLEILKRKKAEEALKAEEEKKTNSPEEPDKNEEIKTDEKANEEKAGLFEKMNRKFKDLIKTGEMADKLKKFGLDGSNPPDATDEDDEKYIEDMLKQEENKEDEVVL